MDEIKANNIIFIPYQSSPIYYCICYSFPLLLFGFIVGLGGESFIVTGTPEISERREG